MTATPKKTTKKTAKTSVRVRMYNVGFGDCFLLRIPTTEGERRVLVDCGYHSLGRGAFDDHDLVKQIDKDLDGAGLDVVVATHRHQDHISGFGQRDLWEKIPVEEVWLPFTADPEATTKDPAFRAWEGLLRGVEALVDAQGRLSAAANAALAVTPWDRESAAWMLWNARANKPAIENLLTGMRNKRGTPARRRFLPKDGHDAPFSFQPRRLPGVAVHVLGPARDPKHRRARKVPDGWGVASFSGASSPVRSPFEDAWRIPNAQLPARRPFQDAGLATIRAFNDDLMLAAHAVDDFLNGESLVLAIEVGSACLLLPGDAEVAAWQRILEDPRSLEIASRATFLKVGHHGSTNATPLVFLKQSLSRSAAAMISTQAGANNYRNGIPREEILETLHELGVKCARSDQHKDAPDAFKAEANGRWIDHDVPC